jgi:hypothetical protein
VLTVTLVVLLDPVLVVVVVVLPVVPVEVVVDDDVPVDVPDCDVPPDVVMLGKSTLGAEVGEADGSVIATSGWPAVGFNCAMGATADWTVG